MKPIIEPKILKGTRDFLPDEMAKRNYVMDKMKIIFARFGYDTIETPVLSYAETILGKYGEEGDRLTYTFEDNGGRKIALPYDQTVPFARLFAANYNVLPVPFKRYQIQRVWRAEKPQKGRMREFYQCDIDIIGTANLLAEAELTRLMWQVFTELGINNIKIQINSRRLMNDVMKKLGLENICVEILRIIDKYDKIGEENVKIELAKMISSASKIQVLLDLLRPEATNDSTLAKLADYDVSEVKRLLQLCESFKVPERYLSFNPRLARGLDYYTGIIFEVIGDDINLGSLCGGGRYDDLCGLFCKEKFSGVGVSFGFERIMTVLENLGKLKDVQLNSNVLVTLFDNQSYEDALGVYNLLIDAGIRSEIYFQPDKLQKQLKYADKKRIPFVVLRGPEEIKNQTVSVKALQIGKQKAIPLTQLISYIQGYE